MKKGSVSPYTKILECGGKKEGLKVLLMAIDLGIEPFASLVKT